jgi:LuxR family maltose regulon positive regulatory protein
VNLGVEIRGSKGGVYFPELLCRNGLINVLCDLGDYDEAARQIAIAEARTGRPARALDFTRGLAAARVAFGQGQDSEGLEQLRSAMTLGRSHTFAGALWWWQPREMAKLCQKALAAGIEVEYVRRMIQTHALKPEDPNGSEHWPWPFKIYTLGGFEIVQEGKALTASDKSQQKPLALLKALIAFGGKEVAEEKIMDALWPDADGDRGRHSLKFALHRLRKLLGSDEVVIARKGHYSLDTRQIWTDVGQCERVLQSLEAALTAKRPEAILAAANQAVALGGRTFLPGESEPWTLAARERLRGKYLRILTRAADALAEHDGEAAIPLYEKALDVDPLTEVLYQGLMRTYHRLNRKAEALQTYHRCCDVLKNELRVTPSPSTEALRKMIG